MHHFFPMLAPPTAAPGAGIPPAGLPCFGIPPAGPPRIGLSGRVAYMDIQHFFFDS